MIEGRRCRKVAVVRVRGIGTNTQKKMRNRKRNRKKKREKKRKMERKKGERRRME